MPIEVSTELPALYGCRRAAVAQMKRDDVGLLSRQSTQRTIAESDIAVRRSVKSIAADAMAPVQVVRDGVKVSVLGNGMVERGIEHRHLRSVLAEQLARSQNALDVVGIVQRRKIDTVFNALQHFVVNQCRLGE